MSRPNNRRPQPGGASVGTTLLAVAIGGVVAGVAALNVALRLGHRLDATGVQVPDDPFAVVFLVAGGDLPWPASGTMLLAVVGAVVAVLVLLVLAALVRGGRGRTRVDRAAAFMGRGADIRTLTRASAARTAKRLGVAGAAGAGGTAGAVGVPIGRTVAGGQDLVGSWEDLHLDIWGPRTGKTTSRAVPAILEAPGAVVVTSNKRDVVDATRDVRAQPSTPPRRRWWTALWARAAAPRPGSEVWVFDPQGIALEEPTWWWDPLSYVTDEVKAARLAEHFAAGSRDPEARADAYFDPAGQDLLAGLLLAAALDSRPITDVYTWLTRPTEDRAVDILHAHGFPLSARNVAGVVAAPDKQRGGIYGTAQQMASCLTNRQVARWVTPQGGHRASDPRPHLDPAALVRDHGTLYLLSKEGRGTAGPLVTALTVAVIEAAEDLAVHSPGGRLATPLLAVLDEAANVCRWRDLPDLYSHYGSRGIVLMTILQSWSQGAAVWGESGMKKLLSAANVMVYGGGVNEAAFLEDLSRMIGDHDRPTSSVSTGRGGRGVTHQLHRDRILDVADLAALPKGRAVVFASGARPTLVRTRPWMTGPHATAVKASIAAHDPQATHLLHQARTAAAAAATVAPVTPIEPVQELAP
ncbi:type IV secretory system conjugative DNA transfer family protein [Aquipuribacter hungaricus]|uniref:Type IV secretory system conjugative DNA transfer family protein n=1 Tax=Aquipuribacter hungaricus TaxID=545624 RepID=A0ABV7WPJ6_9MICO